MGVEIERKFLVDHEKWQQLAKPAGIHYRQGYIVDDDQRTIRARLAGEQGFITIKGTTTGITRKEFEYKIPPKDAIELIDDFAEHEVEKIRYRINFADKLWEVDEFLGDNTGLLMAEIELKDANEEFKKPDWLLNEVSDDKRYYNSNLARNPFKNWGR